MINLLVHPNPGHATPKYWAYDAITGQLFYGSTRSWMNADSQKGVGSPRSHAQTMQNKLRKGYLLLSDRVSDLTEMKSILMVICGYASPTTATQKVYASRWRQLHAASLDVPSASEVVSNPLVLPKPIEGSLCYW